MKCRHESAPVAGSQPSWIENNTMSSRPNQKLGIACPTTERKRGAPIDQRIRLERSDDAKRDGEQQRECDAAQSKCHGYLQTLGDQIRHWQPEVVAVAEVALQGLGKPGQVLRNQRPIKPVEDTNRSDVLVGGFLAGDRDRWISCKEQEAERDCGDRERDQNCQQETLQNKLYHRTRVSGVPGTASPISSPC